MLCAPASTRNAKTADRPAILSCRFVIQIRRADTYYITITAEFISGALFNWEAPTVSEETLLAEFVWELHSRALALESEFSVHFVYILMRDRKRGEGCTTGFQTISSEADDFNASWWKLPHCDGIVVRRVGFVCPPIEGKRTAEQAEGGCSAAATRAQGPGVAYQSLRHVPNQKCKELAPSIDTEFAGGGGGLLYTGPLLRRARGLRSTKQGTTM
ncbi:hypothetical protein FB45DRAFT_868533 [Roridomyces roridus]|uniref:Uncharacterized protein n=1 Tax=Roridomyces roridus TaxID=1738132 RepID=A0AAD7FM32_9AGAR|nr:hypothetical protein FB45DRAFT_868533 [Roridomyces roridus]